MYCFSLCCSCIDQGSESAFIWNHSRCRRLSLWNATKACSEILSWVMLTKGFFENGPLNAVTSCGSSVCSSGQYYVKQYSCTEQAGAWLMLHSLEGMFLLLCSYNSPPVVAKYATCVRSANCALPTRGQIGGLFLSAAGPDQAWRTVRQQKQHFASLSPEHEYQ